VHVEETEVLQQPVHPVRAHFRTTSATQRLLGPVVRISEPRQLLPNFQH
jgi:hypothetical protein